MRAHALALVAVLLVGCGDAGSAGTPPIPSGGGPAATTIGDRDCTVSWARYLQDARRARRRLACDSPRDSPCDRPRDSVCVRRLRGAILTRRTTDDLPRH